MLFIHRHPILLPIIFSIFFILGSITIILAKPPSQGTIWQGYRILAVSTSISEVHILDLLKKTNAKKVVSQSTSQLHSTSEYTPYQPQIEKINNDRNKWFINNDQKYRFFFIKEYPSLTDDIHKNFNALQGLFLFEESFSVNSIPNILSLVYFAVVLILVKSRKQVFFFGIPILLFTSVSQTTLDVIPVAVFLFILVFIIEGFLINPFDIQQIDKKNLSSKYFFLNFFPLISIVPFILLPQSRGPLLFVYTLILVVVFWFISIQWYTLISQFKEKKRLHPLFKPVQIQKPDYVFFWKIPGIHKHIIVCIIICAIGITASFFPISISSDHSSLGELSIPIPTGYTTKARGFSVETFSEHVGNRSQNEMPDLADFVIAMWNSQTFPWVKEGFPTEAPNAQATINYTEYNEIAGSLVPATKQVLKFDTSFISEALSHYATPLEAMLMQQNRFVEVKMSRDK